MTKTTAAPAASRHADPGPRRRGAALALAAALAAGLLATGCGATSTDRPAAASAPAKDPRSVVVRPTSTVQVHQSPDATSPARSLEPKTSFGSPTALLVTDQVDGWVQVLVPGRPTGATGWVALDQVGAPVAITTEVHVDLAARKLTLLDGGKAVFATPVAIGAPESPTPTGRFSVTDKLDTQDPGGAYGQYAIGLSGRSEVLTEFAGGDGQIGIHGTDQPDSIGKPVSHGCIRVPNEAMAKLNAVLALGTPVVVA